MRRAGGANAEDVSDRWQVWTERAVLVEGHSVQIKGPSGDCPQNGKNKGAAAVWTLFQPALCHLYLQRGLPTAIRAKTRCQSPLQIALHHRDLGRGEMAHEGNTLPVLGYFL